jgi:hypothetical protein
VATVVPENIRARIDHALGRAHAPWEGLPVLKAESAEWDDESRFHLWVDWPVEEDTLAQLEDWWRQGFMNEGRRERYRKLVERNRPILQQLFPED